MTLDKLSTTDLYDLMDELDRIIKNVGFNSKPYSYRTGVRRMRIYLDHVASGLRMIKGGDYEPHNIYSIHRHNRGND